MLSETHGIIDNTSDYPSGGYPQGIVHDDIDFYLASEAVDDAHSYLGHWVAIRKRMLPEDGEERCSTCYDPVFKGATDENCPECWGTSYSGGYYDTVIKKAIFRNLREQIELKKDGWIRILVPEITIGPEPILREWDLIVRITYNANTGEITETGDRYWVKDVQKIEIAPGYQLIGQRFSVTKLQYNDPIWNLPIG